MKILATAKVEQGHAFLDPWSVVHLGFGLASGLMGIDTRWSLIGAVVYEFVEQYGERQGWGQRLFRTSGPESAENAFADVVVFALGHYLGQKWNDT